MSTDEYNDMFLRCQATGMFHMFTFDLKNCKSMDPETLNDAEFKLVQLVLRTYKQLQTLEYETDRKILLNKLLLQDEQWMNKEPFFLGDAGEITIYRDSITDEQFWEIFNNTKEEVGFDYELHTNDGYYETNHWVEGHDKYARSYCFQLLTDMHKDKYASLRKKIKESQE